MKIGRIILAIIIFMLISTVNAGGSSGEERELNRSNTWGIVISSNLSVGYIDVGFEPDLWFGGPIIEYKILAIGRHDITIEVEYDVYLRNNSANTSDLIHTTGIYEFNDSMYMFDLSKRPIVKFYVKNGFLSLFKLFDHGEWWIKLYIDDEVYDEQHGTGEYN